MIPSYALTNALQGLLKSFRRKEAFGKSDFAASSALFIISSVQVESARYSLTIGSRKWFSNNSSFKKPQLQKSKNLWKAHVLSANEIFLLVITFISSLQYVLQDIALFVWYINYVTAKNSCLETGYEESYTIRKKSGSAERFYNRSIKSFTSSAY